MEDWPILCTTTDGVVDFTWIDVHLSGLPLPGMQSTMEVSIARGTLSKDSSQRLSELRVGRGLAERFEFSLACGDVRGLHRGPERALHEGSKADEHFPAGLASSATSESQ
ncbi:hypothetical protein ACJ6WF_23320 [Streptomyces sp. MMS24-I2-30]|uniref:hypothetical protein n=1 Tax=Streptomyces sp. MMS24-I2-30 TaxID=3351564 RepID=UPI0038968F75